MQTNRRNHHQASSVFVYLIFPLFLTIFSVGSVFGQATHIYTQPDHEYQEAKEYFQLGKYAVSMQLFQHVINNISYFQETNRQLVYQDAQYYYAMCALELHQPNGVKLTQDFIDNVNNSPRVQLASYHLAKHFYHLNRFREAIPYFEKAGIDNLSNDQIADEKFELAYCYFNLKDFQKAEPLFADIKDVQGKYYIPANYYYGFIAYYNKQYDEALTSFQRVVNQPTYNIIVPYYIAEIYYFQGKKDQLIQYAEPIIQQGNNYYNLNLKQLVGQAYFEKGEYQKALPYLQTYSDDAKSLRSEDVYELSYCYYETGNLQKAIDGFKQLSNSTDSLGQNSMYLLGDCYLKTGQKASARNAFAFCARSTYNPVQQEISKFNYGKLSYELGYQDAAISTLKNFVNDYPNSEYTPEARELLVHLFMNTNDYKSAYNVLQSIQNPSPDIQRAYQKVTYGRATQLINDNQLDEADHLLDESLKNPVDPQLKQLAYFWKGEIAYRKNNIDAAITDIDNYLNSTSNMPAASGEANVQTANYNLGYCWLHKENYTAALTSFQHAEEVFGADGQRIAQDALLREADCYYMMKDYDNALAIYNKVIANRRQGADYALYQKSIITGIKGNYDEKIQLLNQLSSQYPHSDFNNDADYEIGLTYMDAEKYQQAIPYLKKVIQTQPNSPDAPKAMLKLGLAYFNMNDNDNALNYYQQVIQKYPNSSEADDAQMSLKNIYINNGNTAAYINFMKANGKTVNPSAQDSITYAAAEAKFGNGDYPGALAAFNNYLSQFPDGEFTLEANFYKAECLFSQKDYMGALPAYEYVLSQGNNRFGERSAAQAAAIEFYQAKNYKKARNDYRQLLDYSTSKQNTLTAIRGLLLSDYQLQDWDNVRVEADQLLTSDNISTDDQILGHLYLGEAEKAQNNCDSAIAEFKVVTQLTKSASGAEARYNIAECLYQQNDLKAAEPAAFEVIKSTPSYDYWIAKAYVLLGDIYAAEKDYFNAKATLQSVVDNCKIPEIVQIAKTKLNEVVTEENATSKISDTTTTNLPDTTIQNNQ